MLACYKAEIGAPTVAVCIQLRWDVQAFKPRSASSLSLRRKRSADDQLLDAAEKARLEALSHALRCSEGEVLRRGLEALEREQR